MLVADIQTYIALYQVHFAHTLFVRFVTLLQNNNFDTSPSDLQSSKTFNKYTSCTMWLGRIKLHTVLFSDISLQNIRFVIQQVLTLYA